MTECPTSLLPDDPAHSDAFGSHGRIADALAMMIVDDEGGRSVALEGRWGSGKSSIVKFLTQKLTERNTSTEYGVFIFDTWAHRDDSLRRSFLNRLVHFCRDEGWADEDQWSELLDELAGRKEEHRIRREPVLSNVGTAVAGFLLLAPIGYAMASAAFGWMGFSHSIFWPGVGLAVLPALIVIGANIFSSAQEQKSDSSISSKSKSNKYASLLINKTRDRINKTTISTPEPTSIEFHDSFRKIISDVLTAKDRELVVVVDNLDRIEADQALNIWSTMRTFFDVREFKEADWADRFWLLVPFDGSALENIWAREIGDGQTETNTRGGQEAVDAFLEKSFQVRYHVPPPVTSGWREYFKEHFSRAFPKHDDVDERYTVSRIYEIDRQEQDEDITPRDIKLFINQLGGIHRQWCDRIPLELQAIYVTKRKGLQENIGSLESQEFLGPKIERLVGEWEWRRYLAALHFNVEPEEAMQVWIGGRIEDLLVGGSEDDQAELEEMSDIPGFAMLCEQIIEDRAGEWARSERTSLAAVAKSVAEVDIGAAEPGRSTRIWEELRKAVVGVDGWPNIDRETAEGLVKLLDRVPSGKHDETARQIVTSVRDTSIKLYDKDEWDATDWIEAFTTIGQHVSRGDGEITDQLYVPGVASQYIRIIEALSDAEVSEAGRKLLLTEELWSRVGDVMSEELEQVGATESKAAVLDHFRGLDADIDWNNIRSALQKRIQEDNQEPDAPELAHDMRALLDLVAYDLVAADNLQGVVKNNGHLLHRLHQLNNQAHQQGVAAAVLLLLLTNPKAEVNRNVGSANNGKSVYDSICRSPEEHRDLVSEVLRLALERGVEGRLFDETPVRTLPIVGVMIAECVEKGVDETALDSDYIIRYWDDLDDRLDGKVYRNLLEQLIYVDELLPVVAGGDFETSNAPLYLDIWRTADEVEAVSEDYVEFLSDGLRSVESESWYRSIKRADALVHLAEVVEERKAGSIGVEFRMGLETYREKLAAAEGASSDIDMRSLLRCLEPDERELFLKDTVDELLGWENVDSDALIAEYGEFLATVEGYVVDRADEVVRRLFRPIVEHGSIGTVRWLLGFIRNVPSIVSAASESTRADFVERVERHTRDAEEDGETERSKTLKRIYREVAPSESEAESEVNNNKDRDREEEPDSDKQ